MRTNICQSILPFVLLAATILAAPSHAQDSRFVPLLDFHRSSNAFSGTTADRIFRDGVEIDTPALLRPRPDTVIGIGAIWLNALRMEAGSFPIALSPFLRHQRFLESGEHSIVYGGLLTFSLLEGPDERVDLRANLSRLETSWMTGSVDDLSLRLGYSRALREDTQYEISLSAGRRWVTAGDPISRLNVDVRYRTKIGAFQLTSEARTTLRSAAAPGLSGQDTGLRFTLGRDFGSGQAYTRLDMGWSADDSARTGQSASRNAITTVAEIGYGWPLDASGLGRLTAYARNQKSTSNLAIYDSLTTVVGLGLRLGF
jgi:hypothetical protein